jgi:hypothetical protein
VGKYGEGKRAKNNPTKLNKQTSNICDTLKIEINQITI